MWALTPHHGYLDNEQLHNSSPTSQLLCAKTQSVHTSASRRETIQKPPRHSPDDDDASLCVVNRAKNQPCNEPPEFQAGRPSVLPTILRLSWLGSCATGKGCLAFDSVA